MIAERHALTKAIYSVLALVFALQFMQIQVPSPHHDTDLDIGQYRLIPLHSDTSMTGANVHGLDLCTLHLYDQSTLDDLVTRLKTDIHHHEFLILKNQCIDNNYTIPPHIYSDFASRFGVIADYARKYKDNRNPDTNISAFSNDDRFGKTVVGSEGWHIDGTAEIRLNPIVFQHIVSVPIMGVGGTEIISSKLLIDSLKTSNLTLYTLLNRLYISKTIRQYVHPVVAMHPTTGNEYMVIHTAFSPIIHELVDDSMISEFNADFIRGNTVLQKGHHRKGQHQGTKLNDGRLRLWSIENAKALIQSVEDFIESECREKRLIHVVEYEKGDLLIRDNLAVLHKGPSPETIPKEKVGLRLLWRITLEGNTLTSKV